MIVFIKICCKIKECAFSCYRCAYDLEHIVKDSERRFTCSAFMFDVRIYYIKLILPCRDFYFSERKERLSKLFVFVDKLKNLIRKSLIFLS